MNLLFILINILIPVFSLNCSNNISYYTNSCPNSLITPDCNYINSNLYTICNSLANSTEVINGFGCFVQGSNDGCNFLNGQNDSSNKIFCCNPVLDTNSITTTSNQTSNPIPSFSSIKSNSPTSSCAYRSYNSGSDFSATQGKNGWYYGYYNGATFTQFTNYAVSSTGSVGSVVSWNYNQASNGIISSTMIMQNGALSCNTQTYGNIAPVLRWYNPVDSCYQDITIWLILTGNSNSAGSIVSLTVNGAVVYSFSGVPTINSYFNAYGVRSVELSVGPANSNCDYGQSTYSLIISAIGASNSVIPSKSNTVSSSFSPSPRISGYSTNTIMNTYSIIKSISSTGSPLASYSSLKSNTISSSSSQTKTSSASIESTDSLRNSKTNTATASSSATVFYSGNWTDYGDVYFTSQVEVITGPITINQCMISCWLDQLCGGISVNYGCSNVVLDSPQIFTLQCAHCRLIPKSTEIATYPGIFSQHSEWKSFIIYDKIFPPTTSVISSKTSTISPNPTSTLVMNSNYNMCNNNGKTITLPFPESYTILRTNEPGTQYTNNMNCDMTIRGGNARQVFQINITSFNTEACCDFLKIYDASGAQVFSNAGTTIPNSFFISSTSIRLQMTTDGSVVSSGVIVQITLYLLSNTPSPSASNSPRESRTLSGSSSLSKSGYPSNTITSYQSLSKTSISSVSVSVSPLASFSSSSITSFSKSSKETYSSKFTNTQSSIITYSPIISHSSVISNTPTSSSNISHSSIISNTPISSASVSNYNSESHTSSKSNSNSPLNTLSIIQSISASISLSISQTLSTSPTYSSSISPSQFIRLSNDQIGAKLIDSFIGNKTSLSLNETTAIFNSISNLPAAQITNLLRTAGVLTLVGNPDVPFEIATDTFSFLAQVIPPKPLNITTSNLKLSIPNLNISGSAVSIITWNENPFQVGQKLDTNVLSVSVSKLTGQEVGIHNLTEPLQFKYKLNLDPTDSRINIATYKINCFDNLNYKITATGPSFVNLEKNNSKYNIPCYDKNYTIGCALNDTLITFNCPKPVLQAKCMYWNNTLGIWDDQGCSVVSVTNSELICNCSHLTDFGSRFEAVYKSNKDIFSDAGSVYSLEGLEKYKQFYITFGVLAIVGFLAFGFGLYLDIISANKYYESLIKLPIIKQLKQKTGCLIDICYEYSVSFKEIKSDNNSDNNYIEKNINSRCNMIKRFIFIWWNRLLFQHSHLSAFLRFDPRMPRLFRLLIIFVAQFNSLFLTAFLYAFKYGDESVGANVETVTLIDIILLAVITAALNTPCMTILIRMTNLAGIEEFKWRYPILYDELIRRHDFENELLLFKNEELDIDKLNIIKYKNDLKRNNKLKNKQNNKQNDSNINNNLDGGDTEDGIMNRIFSYFFFSKKKDIFKEKGSIDNAYKIANKPYPLITKKPAYYSYFPFHTKIGGLIFCVSIGWFIWCLNYLLLFAAHHNSNVSTNMLTSFGISEITTVFITQPITLFFLMLITYIINLALKKLNYKKTNIQIPSIYYFSDPFIKPYSTMLSTSFAYNIFLNSPANLIESGVQHKSVSKNLGYAPLNGIIESIESNELDKITIDERHEKIIELYEILKDKNKLNNLTNVIYINDLDDYIDYSNNNIIIKQIDASEKNINQMYVKTINNNLNYYHKK